jgi:hypothetical protein
MGTAYCNSAIICWYSIFSRPNSGCKRHHKAAEVFAAGRL